VKRPQKPPVLPPVQNAVVEPFNSTIPLSHEKLIGRVVVEFSKLEAAMDDLIWNFLNLPMEYGRIVTSRMDALSKTTMLRNLSSLAFDPLLQAYLSEILDTVDMLREHRNLIVHGTWGRSSSDKIPIALSLRIKDTPSTVVSETFPPERMQAISTSIQITKWKLISLFDSASTSYHRVRPKFPGPTPTPP
jgi:hypothetical protein